MTMVAASAANDAIPDGWHADLAQVDQQHVTRLFVWPRPLGVCTFCPPDEPARDAFAQLLFVHRRYGLQMRDVGACCIRKALARTIAGHGPVTVVQGSGAMPVPAPADPTKLPEPGTTAFHAARHPRVEQGEVIYADRVLSGACGICEQDGGKG